MNSAYFKDVPVLKKLEINPAQFTRTFQLTTVKPQIPALLKAFPNIQGLDDSFRIPFLIALSFYPELRHSRIKIQQKKIGTTMRARPMWRALFKRRNKHYELAINNAADFKGVPFDSIPFNAKVGIIGHELAHFLDYEHKNNFQLLRTLIQYMYKKGRIRYENAIDYLTICKGLGWQLHDWSKWSMYESSADEEYKAFKRSVYLGPQAIEGHIREILG